MPSSSIKYLPFLFLFLLTNVAITCVLAKSIPQHFQEILAAHQQLTSQRLANLSDKDWELCIKDSVVEKKIDGVGQKPCESLELFTTLKNDFDQQSKSTEVNDSDKKKYKEASRSMAPALNLMLSGQGRWKIGSKTATAEEGAIIIQAAFQAGRNAQQKTLKVAEARAKFEAQEQVSQKLSLHQLFLQGVKPEFIEAPDKNPQQYKLHHNVYCLIFNLMGQYGVDQWERLKTTLYEEYQRYFKNREVLNGFLEPVWKFTQKNLELFDNPKKSYKEILKEDFNLTLNPTMVDRPTVDSIDTKWKTKLFHYYVKNGLEDQLHRLKKTQAGMTDNAFNTAGVIETVNSWKTAIDEGLATRNKLSPNYDLIRDLAYQAFYKMYTKDFSLPASYRNSEDFIRHHFKYLENGKLDIDATVNSLRELLKKDEKQKRVKEKLDNSPTTLSSLPFKGRFVIHEFKLDYPSKAKKNIDSSFKPGYSGAFVDAPRHPNNPTRKVYIRSYGWTQVANKQNRLERHRITTDWSMDVHFQQQKEFLDFITNDALVFWSIEEGDKVNLFAIDNKSRIIYRLTGAAVLSGQTLALLEETVKFLHPLGKEEQEIYKQALANDQARAAHKYKYQQELNKTIKQR